MAIEAIGERLNLEESSKTLAVLYDALVRGRKIGTMPASIATCGTTAILVLASNNARAFALIMNDSDTAIYLSFVGTINAMTSQTGVRLNASGGSFQIDWSNLWKGAIYALTSAASKNLQIVEGLYA